MALEFGLRSGLAQDFSYDKQINDLRYQAAEKRQAQNIAENKAKMFADDFDYNNAMNAYDNPKVKEFAQFQIKRIGQFVNQNPDWETNVSKRAQYKQLIHDLKDNPDLNRGLLTDKNWQDAQKDMADIKYANVDFAPIKQQYDNYLKYGNQLGEDAAKSQGHTPFTYITPAPRVDTSKLLAEEAGKVQHDLVDSFGYRGYKQYVSDARKNLAAENMIANGELGPQLKLDYQSYLGQLNGNERTNAKTINQFVRERMEPFFAASKIDKGFDLPTSPSVSGKGVANMTPNIWNSMINQAIKTPDRQIDFGSAALDATFGNKYGEYNLDGVKAPDGSPINLGLQKAASTGLVVVHKGDAGGKPYAEHGVVVRVPVDQFEQLGPQYDKVIDEKGLGQFTPGASSNVEIRDNYKKDYSIYTDKDNKNYVQFKVYHKFDPSNSNIADNYANAHNVKQHEDTSYDVNNESMPVINSQEGFNALKIGQQFKDEEGNIRVKQK